MSRDARGDRFRAGMTLIELVVAIVVVSISLGGTLMLADATTRRSADPMLEHQAISIAEAYLEEILQKSYFDPDTGALCPAPEAQRRLYDNLCDYQGLDERGARDQNGAAIAGLDGYRVEIEVDLSARLGSLSGSPEVLRVDAVVTDPSARSVIVSGYRSAP